MILIIAISFIAITSLASFIRFQNLAKGVRLEGQEGINPEDQFHILVVGRIGTAHREPNPFCVMQATLANLETWEEQGRHKLAGELARHVSGFIKKNIRTNDSMVDFEEVKTGAIIETAREKVSGVLERIIRGVANEQYLDSTGIIRKVRIKAGISSFPQNGDRAQLLIQNSESALNRAMENSSLNWIIAEEESPEPGPEGEPSSEDKKTEPKKSESPSKSDQSILDKLTGVLKPERLGAAGQKYIARYRRDELPVSLLYIDVDYLNRYNEHYGSRTGDAILRQLGQILQDNVREEDLIGRYGGEEFVIFMACRAMNAERAGKRLVEVVKRYPFKTGTTNLKITISVGVAGYPDHGALPRHLFNAASTALHATKEAGRSQCMMFDPAMPRPSKLVHPAEVF